MVVRRIRSKAFSGFLPALTVLSVLYLLTSSCINSGSGNSQAGFLPHPSDWGGAGRHGLASISKGLDACATNCHGEDLSGGFTGLACAACHPSYPHPSGWDEPATHGDYSVRFGVETRCAGCHGDDFTGDHSGVSCIACHRNFPHPAEWIEARVHGFDALSQGITAGCATLCHGTDFLGGLTTVSCYDCHASFPHPSEWEAFDSHGAFAAAEASASCATVCHGTDFTGGDTDVSCFACHGNYPHLNWEPPGDHKPWVLENTDASCITVQGCHNEYRGPIEISATCTNFCHRPPGKGRR